MKQLYVPDDSTGKLHRDITPEDAAAAWNLGELEAQKDTTPGSLFRGAHRAADENGFDKEGVSRRCFTGGYFAIANRTGGVTLDAEGRTLHV